MYCESFLSKQATLSITLDLGRRFIQYASILQKNYATWYCISKHKLCNVTLYARIYVWSNSYKAAAWNMTLYSIAWSLWMMYRERYYGVGSHQPGSSDTHHSCLASTRVLCPKDNSQKVYLFTWIKMSYRWFGVPDYCRQYPHLQQMDVCQRHIELFKHDDGEGIQTTFEHHKVRWHHSCRLESNKTQLFLTVSKWQLPQGSTPVRV